MGVADSKIQLTSIDVFDHTVNILWKDGHENVYPHKFLRERCSCAQCTGAPGAFSRAPIDVPKIPDGVKPIRFGQVGRYAITISWSDGHSTGIYSYEYLRAMCPCSLCVK